ncbi:hypothetical protein I8752_29630 [Nostocaceae cyanobacterium CENA369]|uniref:Uncharacterized protein n=1 Tax=Dendronalium phyllosphericum CENA369 TaxID=1725256 RepID=A0A8J7IF03_9NOST|nr:hypothetical protein [Dendronalium phyllosphericum]MBH8577070.1 hypothetical protein [Dendronalium phyllosphericum CENA369]
MKIINLLGFGIAGTILLVTGGLFIKEMIDKSDIKVKNDLDEWVDRLLAESLSRKLNYSPSSIFQALNRGEDTELTRKITELIESVELVFQRRSSLSTVEVFLNASFQDGTSFCANTQRTWDDLPFAIRKEFLQRNDTSITVPWNLPLVNSQSIL